MNRGEFFLQHLYKEKEIHKEHRHKHVVYKLVLTGSFFGLGQFTSSQNLFCLFLYVVPFIALVHDVYIIGEHLKVQRVGQFIKHLSDIKGDSVCLEEVIWEKYLVDNRETWAYKASLLYSLIISTFSAIAIHTIAPPDSEILYVSWLYMWLVLLVVVWARAAMLVLRKRDESKIREMLKSIKAECIAESSHNKTN